MSDPVQAPINRPLRPLPRLIFASRWLQLPLYLGLILAQAVYVVHFIVELEHLIAAAFGSQTALQALVTSIGYKSDVPITALNETVIMLVVLALIDVVMISHLLIMVIVGGSETFVSRLRLEGHEDQPEWLDHVNASVLKVKLALSIIGISSTQKWYTYTACARISPRYSGNWSQRLAKIRPGSGRRRTGARASVRAWADVSTLAWGLLGSL